MWPRGVILGHVVHQFIPVDYLKSLRHFPAFSYSTDLTETLGSCALGVVANAAQISGPPA